VDRTIKTASPFREILSPGSVPVRCSHS